MLDRQHRFHGLTSLTAVHRRGTAVRGQLMALRYLRRQPADQYRLAIIVSRKVHKSAVQRNRVRRRIYELVRQFKITEPYDLVLSVFSDQVITLEPAQLEQLVRNLFIRAHVIGRGTPTDNRLDRGIVKGTRGPGIS